MQGLEQLKALTDRELLIELPRLVQRDNQHTAKLLTYLAEVDARHLYAGLGFTSLFSYCVKSIGFCESSAGRRIAAARVCRRFPEAFTHVSTGELHLSALSALKPYLTPGNATELFTLCARKGIREIEGLLAARFPKPLVRDSIRRLPQPPLVPAPEALPTSGAGSADEPSTSAPPSSAPAPSTLQPPAPLSSTAPPRPRRSVVPLSADRFGVHFTADTEFRELLEEVRDLASHHNPRGELLPLMKAAFTLYKSALLKQRFGVGKKDRKRPLESTAKSSTPKVAANAAEQPHAAASASTSARQFRRRHRSRITAATLRALLLRDEGQCTYCSPAGERCRARRFLQVDHVTPWVLGPDNRLANLRLRCHAHNQHHARAIFGARYLRAAIARSRPKHATASIAA